MRAAVLPWILVFALAHGETSASADEPNPRRIEIGGVPFVGGDSDVGIGVGEVSSIARFEPGYDPWRWRLETSLFATYKPGEVPYQDYSATLTLPDVLKETLRLELRPSYTRETTLRYYGMGNAAPPRDGLGLFYGRAHPTLRLRAHLDLSAHVYVREGLSYTYNVVDVPPNTRLAQDMATGSPEVKGLLGEARDHSVFLFEHTLVLDTRNDEVNPRSGTWDALSVRISPGGTRDFPYRYMVLDATARGYVPLVKGHPHVTLALRAVADVQLGQPPFYELMRYEDTAAIGGTNGVRGIPAGRYYGRVKILGSAELRTEFATLHVFGSELGLGLATFLDTGRVWADTAPHPELDGVGLGLKYGVGGGPRLRMGKQFVARADIAWSPDAEPIGVYFTAGQTF